LLRDRVDEVVVAVDTLPEDELGVFAEDVELGAWASQATAEADRFTPAESDSGRIDKP
jgi:hypothetical protein